MRRKIRDVSTLAKVASVLGFASALERDASIRDVNAVVAGTGQWWLTESNRATVHE